MKYYKLTNRNGYSYQDTYWSSGTTHKAIGIGNRLCSNDVIHVYDHPLKAIMFNPIHANFKCPLLWKVKVKGIVANDGLKVGAKQVTAIEEVEVPSITTNQRVRFAIYCALEVCAEPSYVRWAKKWLSKQDRSSITTNDAARVAATHAAYAASYVTASCAAAAATHAAYAAAYAAAHATASCAAAAASAAAYAVDAAAHATKFCSPSKKLNLVMLIKKAIKDEPD